MPLLSLLEPVDEGGEAAHALHERNTPRGGTEHAWLLLPVLAEKGLGILLIVVLCCVWGVWCGGVGRGGQVAGV